jgi:hypothetical protein
MAVNRSRGVFHDLQLTGEQRTDIAKTLRKARPESRPALARLCSAVIRHDGDGLASDAEMLAIKTAGKLIDTARAHAYEIPSSAWQGMIKDWQDRRLAHDFYDVVSRMLYGENERTLDQAAAVKEAANTLLAYDGDPAHMKDIVSSLRRSLQGRYISVPMVGTRDAGVIKVTYAVDPEEMTADMRRLVEQAIPKFLPDEPVFTLSVDEAPLKDDGDTYVVLAGRTSDEARLVSTKSCDGVPVRTFWTGDPAFWTRADA